MFIVNQEGGQPESWKFFNASLGWVPKLIDATSYPLSQLSRPPGSVTGSMSAYVMTRAEFIKFIAANHATGNWVNTRVLVALHDDTPVSVGIKTFGKWIQRIEVADKPYWSMQEAKTVRGFKEQLVQALTYLAE